MYVPRNVLGSLATVLGEGAVGKVYEVDYRLPGDPRPMAYKQIHSRIPNRDLVLSDLVRAVQYRQILSSADQADLDRYAAWPVAVVVDELGQPVGALLPVLPDDFFMFTSPKRGEPMRTVRSVAWFSATEGQCRNLGIDRTDFTDAAIRLSILTQLVYAVGRLHKHGIIYGDLSLKNAAFALNPPRLILIDCDSVAHSQDLSRQQLNSPFFLAPECLAPGSSPVARGNPHFQNMQTDIYKLALCVVRGLTQGSGATQVVTAEHLISLLGGPATATLRRALGENPASRPSAKELFEALFTRVNELITPPEITKFELSSNRGFRSQDVVVSWEVSNAELLRLTGPNGAVVNLNPDWRQVSVKLVRGGFYRLEAANIHGVHSVDSPFLTVIDIPDFSLSVNTGRLASTPELPAVLVPEVVSALPMRPLVISEYQDFAPPPFPKVSDIAGGLAGVTSTLTAEFSLSDVLPKPDLDGFRELLTHGIVSAEEVIALAGDELRQQLVDTGLLDYDFLDYEPAKPAAGSS